MHRTLWIALLSSAGCYQGTGSSPDLEAPYEDDEVVPDDGGDDAPVAVDPVTLPDDGESVATDPGPAVDPAPDGTICAGGGTLDFEVHASALAAAWEGVAVMAAAIENDIMTDPTT